MHILMIAPTPYFSHRGTHIRILEEARALEARGHTITIATYHIGEDPKAYIDTQIDVRRILRLLFWYKKTEAGPDWQKILLNIMLIRKVFNLTRTQKPDVIHAHLHEGVLIGWLIQKLFFFRTILLVADFHGSLVKEMVSHAYLSVGPLRRLFGWAERAINNMGDVAIASAAENAAQIAAVREDKAVHVIEDGVNGDDYADLPDKATLRAKYGVPQDKVIVVYTGALIANKGIGLLLEAARNVCARRDDVHFVFGGSPVADVERLVEELQLQDRVTLISPLSYFTVPEINHLADIAVDPKNEPTQQASGKVLQYMGAGCAIVCFDRPTNRHYLGDDGGIYVQKPTADALAEAIATLVADPQMVAQYGAAAALRISQFTWYNSGEKIEAVYQTKKAIS